MKKNILVQVTTNPHGASLQVCDGKEGCYYLYQMPWAKLEAFIRKNGEKHTMGELPRNLSNTFRGLMESEE
jgi:hypothetical protein